MADYDYLKGDPEGTDVNPVSSSNFEFERFEDYEAKILKRSREFWEKKEGVAVYRKFRVPEVFSYACKNFKDSLELQLGALKKSISYISDIPNFIEPWYGIGTVASSFGVEYYWRDEQAPMTKPIFKSVEDALNYDYIPVEETSIGKKTLDMIKYFKEKTKGKVPISFTDTQSPLNIATYLVEANNLYLETIEKPKMYNELLNIITNLIINFTQKQENLIGDALVRPGHGFASNRCFDGIGMSDDNMIMISDDHYKEHEIEYRNKLGDIFGGVAFHSCGNWTKRIPIVKKINNLIMVDGAFTAETDPNPNDLNIFGDKFAKTDVIIHARMVGSINEVINSVKEIWRPGLKLIVATYFEEPKIQKKAYDEIHAICK